MNNAEIIQKAIEDFSRVQKWMLSVKEKDITTYNLMYERYIELKVTLTSLGVNLTELDKIKD
ncbi:MAG: hypothetical protein K1W37_17025 [Lachnospiraceae bacterium]